MSTKRKLDEETTTIKKQLLEMESNANEDSDESDSDGNEDELQKKYGVLDEDQIEGQEESTHDFDGDIKITPFNLKEEMEEGHFDGQGSFVWKKEDDIKDHWLDNIDWVKVKHVEKTEQMDDSNTEEPELHTDDLYRQILEIIKPGESVGKALRRLGGGKTMSALERLKAKKKSSTVATVTEEEKQNREILQELTGLADKVLRTTGNMDIYQETYEAISFRLQKSQPKPAEDALDMFGDDFDEKETNRLQEKTDEDDKPSETEIRWEVRRENSDSAEVEGPHTTQQMIQWVNDGTFKDEVWVRKAGEEGPFYTSRRIDFELYV